MTVPVWVPSPERVERANLTRFIAECRTAGANVPDFAALWRWSVEHPEAFWAAVWKFCGIIADERGDG
ncbi:MAG TPA: hypothetical protein VFO96_09940, partial [Gemmatimonadales bacterium]|nr:hypothetical protein [Gemmatimonadales bacterium]